MVYVLWPEESRQAFPAIFPHFPQGKILPWTLLMTGEQVDVLTSRNHA